MVDGGPSRFRAPLEQFQAEADALLAAWRSGDDAAAWRFKWMHPQFRARGVEEVRSATLELSDAQAVVAREESFETWADLASFIGTVSHEGPVARFETAADAVVSGDVSTLGSMLREHPELARARSARSHHATLLHYVAANGVEGWRQETPANALEVATLLLDAGAEVDALADMYDAKCTTMSMLVSSSHPAKAGLQGGLAELLLDRGAAQQGPGSNWQSAVETALTFGFLDTAQRLARRGGPLDDLSVAAGLGRVEDTARLLPGSDPETRHIALALAAQHDQVEVVRLLLDAGEDPNRHNPEGHHSHSTPLHQAALSNHLGVVRLLVERGARLDLRDTLFQGTPLGWANHGGATTVADYLRARGAPT